MGNLGDTEPLPQWTQIRPDSSSRVVSDFVKRVILLTPSFASQLVLELRRTHTPCYASWTCYVEHFIDALQKRRPLTRPQVFELLPIASSPFSQCSKTLESLLNCPGSVLINCRVVWNNSLIIESTRMIYRLTSLLAESENSKSTFLGFNLFTPYNTSIHQDYLLHRTCSWCSKSLRNTLPTVCGGCDAYFCCSHDCLFKARLVAHNMNVCGALAQLNTGFIRNWTRTQI